MAHITPDTHKPCLHFDLHVNPRSSMDCQCLVEMNRKQLAEGEMRTLGRLAGKQAESEYSIEMSAEHQGCEVCVDLQQLEVSVTLSLV